LHSITIMTIRFPICRPAASSCFFKTGVAALFALVLTLGVRADETAPSPCGKSFTVSGDITHYATKKDVTVEGAPADDTYAGEVFGKTFTANVEGLPEGDYTIEIDEAEVYQKGPGQRVMTITSGTTTLADSLDLFATAGFAKAYQVQGKVHHAADSIGGPFTITFTASHGEAKFNAIRIDDAQGNTVACVKAVDLVDVGDAAAAKIPTVTAPEIYSDASKPMDARIDDLISRMSLAEKAGQLVNAAVAIPRLNLPAYNYWSECLHGVARNGHATVFPQAIGMAATWDQPLIHQEGLVIADEARAKYYQAIRDGEGGKDNHGLNFWAPNINIFRDPRWGRGQETYGEDPFLTSRIAIGFITGIQQTKDGYLEAMACAKHFAVHSGPESTRHVANVDPTPRDLYETYLPAFQAAVEIAHVGAVMAAYNAVNGVPAPASKFLLTDTLRTAWGFQGHVVSDCGAVGDISGGHHYVKGGPAAAAAAINAGCDLECGGTYRNLPQAIAQGLTTEQAVDHALHLVLEIRFRLGLFDPPAKVPFSNIAMTEVESPEHLALARRTAAESIVLLKNDGVLPLDPAKVKRIAVLGANAKAALNGNYNGDPTHTITLFEGIQDAAGSTVTIDFAKGAPLVENPKHPNDDVSPEDFQKAVDMAAKDDVIIYIGGLNSGLEGEESSLVCPGFYHGDRTKIELPDPQEKLLHALQATGKPVIFINCSGSAIAMPWEAANLAAIVQAWYPGGQGGAAVADVLFGKYNPAGRLPITFYDKTEDLPDFTDYHMADRTYRYYTGKALFPFGFGLSYTTFRYDKVAPVAAPVAAGDMVHINVPVANTGSRDGEEVVQVYVKNLNTAVPQPIRSLVAFQRVNISAGTTKQVAFDIPVERFHYWSVEKNKYVVDPGAYDLEIGGSSEDLPQTCRITVADK
jgi:beta-glucosidase